MKKIMFVCTGNICRSAMAHQYMQKKVFDLNIQEKIYIDSCGIYANMGDKSTDNAINVMKKYEVDLSKHRAKNVDDVDIEKFDIILCMTVQHKNMIIYLYPFLKDKTFTLKEYIDLQIKNKDIDDPWGMNLQVYADCASEIIQNVDKLLIKIKKDVENV